MSMCWPTLRGSVAIRHAVWRFLQDGLKPIPSTNRVVDTRHFYEPASRSETRSTRRLSDMWTRRYEDMLQIPLLFVSALTHIVAMPIRPENRWLYPIDWQQLSVTIRFDRAGARCERWARPHLRFVAHLGDGRWWDADTGYWRSDRGRRIAVRERFDMLSVRTTYVVLACTHCVTCTKILTSRGSASRIILRRPGAGRNRQSLRLPDTSPRVRGSRPKHASAIVKSPVG